MSTREQEQFIRQVHQRHPGHMATVWRSGVVAGTADDSYHWLARQVLRCRRVLDVGGGSGVCAQAAVAVTPTRPTWTTLDLSPDELALVDERWSMPLLGRAQDIPCGAAAFDGVVSHLALTLMPDEEVIVAELVRVLQPGGTLALVVGGGPRTGSLLERALDMALPFATEMPRLGSRAFRDPARLRSLFAVPSWSQLALTDLTVCFPRDMVVPWVLSQYEFALLAPDAVAQLSALLLAHVEAAPTDAVASAALTGVVARRMAF